MTVIAGKIIYITSINHRALKYVLGACVAYNNIREL